MRFEQVYSLFLNQKIKHVAEQVYAAPSVPNFMAIVVENSNRGSKLCLIRFMNEQACPVKMLKRLAICTNGGGSLGAYEAGALYELVEGLRPRFRTLGPSLGPCTMRLPPLMHDHSWVYIFRRILDGRSETKRQRKNDQAGIYSTT